MKKFGNLTINILFGSVIILIIFYITLVSWVKNEKFYLSQFEQNNASVVIGITENELLTVNNVVVDYIFDKRDDINITVDSKGEKDFYTAREVQHMKDVKKLFDVGKQIVYISIFAFTAICYYLYKKGKLLLTLKNSVYFNWVFVIVTFILSFVTYINFNYFFIKFHKLFFNNDLWILDPSKDMMINMYTLDFFINISRKIFITFVIKLSLYSICVTLFYKSINIKNKFK